MALLSRFGPLGVSSQPQPASAQRGQAGQGRPAEAQPPANFLRAKNGSTTRLVQLLSRFAQKGVDGVNAGRYSCKQSRGRTADRETTGQPGTSSGRTRRVTGASRHYRESDNVGWQNPDPKDHGKQGAKRRGIGGSPIAICQRHGRFPGPARQEPPGGPETSTGRLARVVVLERSRRLLVAQGRPWRSAGWPCAQGVGRALSRRETFLEQKRCNHAVR
jgi:hypothetical protein